MYRDILKRRLRRRGEKYSFLRRSENIGGRHPPVPPLEGKLTRVAATASALSRASTHDQTSDSTVVDPLPRVVPVRAFSHPAFPRFPSADGSRSACRPPPCPPKADPPVSKPSKLGALWFIIISITYPFTTTDGAVA